MVSYFFLMPTADSAVAIIENIAASHTPIEIVIIGSTLLFIVEALS